MHILPIDEGDPYQNTLVYGEFGSGKTRLAGSASEHEDMAPVLFVNCEGGELTIRGQTGMMKTERIYRIKQVNRILEELQHGKHEFRTVVIDSITAVRDIMVEEIISMPNRKLEVPTIQEWGLINSTIKRLVRHFVHLPMHTVFTALPRFYYPKSKQENPAVGPVEVTPDFSRKLTNSICAMVDNVWYLYTDPSKNNPDRRRMLTASQDVYVAKTRGREFYEAIGPVIENPNLAELYTTLLKVGAK